MFKAQQHVNRHFNNGEVNMGKRNVFYDESGKELACYVQENGELYLEIKDEDQTKKSISLGAIDAALFILDLYRMKRKLSNE